MSSSSTEAAHAAQRDLHAARRRLERAYERDLPTTFVQYGEPELLGRRPAPYSVFLSYIYQQQCFNRNALRRHRDEVRRLPPTEQEARAVGDEGDRHMNKSAPVYHEANTFPDLVWRSLETVMKAAAGKDGDKGMSSPTPRTHASGGMAAGTGRSRGISAAQDAVATDSCARMTAVDGSDDCEDVVEARAKVLHYLFPRAESEAKAMQSGGTSPPPRLTAPGQQSRFGDLPVVVDHDVFCGMRQIPVMSPDYMTTLHDWLGAFGGTHTVPDVLSSLLVAGRIRSSKNASTGSSGADAAVSNAVQTVLEAFHHNPVVTPNPAAVLNALLPPRLLLYYDIDPLLAAAHFRKRLQRMEHIAKLEAENARHAGNKPLLLALAAEREALRTEDPVIGDVMILVEQASPTQANRLNLIDLERQVNHALRQTRARCWGTPLPTNAPATSPRGAHAATTVNTAKAATPIKTPVSIVASPEVATPPDEPNFYLTIKKNVKPHALNRASGGTATVIPTLNLLELSTPRTVIQYDMLGKELLRQVVLDLPERGVLLARLFNGTDLALRCYAELVKEATQGAMQHKSLEGLEEVHAHARERIAALEAEVAELRQTNTALQSRKQALENWAEERRAADEARQQHTESFQQVVLERLQRHTEKVRAAQDRERRGSNLE